MRQKKRIRGTRRIAAGAMALFVGLAALHSNGGAFLTVKAEETAETEEETHRPRTLTVDEKKVIVASNIQDDGVADNEDTVYQGTGWYYDGTENQLVLENASITGVYSGDGDLTIRLSGENTINGKLRFYSGDGARTLKLTGSDQGSVTIRDHIWDNSITPGSLKIIGATVKVPEISVNGSLQIEDSEVYCAELYGSSWAIYAAGEILITDSYVEAKSKADAREAIYSSQEIKVSGSQVMAGGGVPVEDWVIAITDCKNSVITRQWMDEETGVQAVKTSVSGTASLKKALTVADGERIDFLDGAVLTNPELLTLEDGAGLLVNGVEHTHDTDDKITYTWKNSTEHIKETTCPVGHTEEEAHHYDEQGFCIECGAYEPAEWKNDYRYEIGNAGQLYWFAGLVNGTLPGEEQDQIANAALINDITVNEQVLENGALAEDTGGLRSWTPIGNEASPYAGMIDGQNHTISGLFCNEPSKDDIGFAGCLSEMKNGRGAIFDVRLKDCWISGNNRVGGICGSSVNGIIDNCYVEGVITAQGSMAGGICGLNSGYADGCGNAASVTAEEYAGGICGKNDARLHSYYDPEYGGMVEAVYDGTVRWCMNIGTVTAERVSGPIVGGIGGSDRISDCCYLSDTETDTFDGTTAKNKEAFASGEAAWLLQAELSFPYWGQTIGTDPYPVLGGAQVYRSSVYKGCEGNPGEPIAYLYSNTEQEDQYGEHTDSDNDGRCDVCDTVIDGMGVKLAGYSLSLSENIGVNFYMELTDDIVNDESAYMNITLPNGKTQKVYVSGEHEDGTTAWTDTTVKDGVTYYVFSCGVAAKEMTAEIRAQMIAGNGEKKGTEYTYTVKEYADYLLSHPLEDGSSEEEIRVDEAMRKLVKSMLYYGGAAQKYFGYQTDDLASDDLELDESFFNALKMIDIDANKAVIVNKNVEEGTCTFMAASLSLNSTTDINVLIKFADDVIVDRSMFHINAEEISEDQFKKVTVNGETCYKITLRGITAKRLLDTQYFEVVFGESDMSPCAELRYGMPSYAYTVMSSACDQMENIEPLRDVVKALYLYGDYAKLYESYLENMTY